MKEYFIRFQNHIDEINKYKRDDDVDNIAMFKRISFSITDLINIDEVNTYSDFLFLISELDIIYDCAHTLVCNISKSDWHENDDMIYFKFIRDYIAHPNGLTSKKYKCNEIFKEYVSSVTDDVTNHVYCRDFYPHPTKNYLSNKKYLFDNQQQKNFSLVLDYKYPKFIELVCPYDNLFLGIDSALQCLEKCYIENATRKEIEN